MSKICVEEEKETNKVVKITELNVFVLYLCVCVCVFTTPALSSSSHFNITSEFFLFLFFFLFSCCLLFTAFVDINKHMNANTPTKNQQRIQYTYPHKLLNFRDTYKL